MKKLHEFTNIGGGGVNVSPPGAGDGEVDGAQGVGIFDLKDIESLDRLNAYLGSLSEKTFINPYTPIQHLRNKMEMVGLSFPMFKVPTDMLGKGNVMENTVRLPLTQFGGMFDPYTGTTTPNAEDMMIEFKLSKLNYRYRIRAELVSPTLDAEETNESIMANLAFKAKAASSNIK